jgi:hypothetical protein
MSNLSDLLCDLEVLPSDDLPLDRVRFTVDAHGEWVILVDGSPVALEESE